MIKFIFIFIFVTLINLCVSELSSISENQANLENQTNSQENPQKNDLHLTNNTDNISHTQNISELKKEEEILAHAEDNEAFTSKLLNEMGLNQGTISKENFKKFMYRLITKDEIIEESETEFYNEVIAKISKNITSDIELKDLHYYIEHNRFVEALDEVVAEKYGQDVLNEVQTVEGEEHKTDL